MRGDGRARQRGRCKSSDAQMPPQFTRSSPVVIVKGVDPVSFILLGLTGGSKKGQAGWLPWQGGPYICVSVTYACDMNMPASPRMLVRLAFFLITLLSVD